MKDLQRKVELGKLLFCGVGLPKTLNSESKLSSPKNAFPAAAHGQERNSCRSPIRPEESAARYKPEEVADFVKEEFLQTAKIVGQGRMSQSEGADRPYVLL